MEDYVAIERTELVLRVREGGHQWALGQPRLQVQPDCLKGKYVNRHRSLSPLSHGSLTPTVGRTPGVRGTRQQELNANEDAAEVMASHQGAWI